MDILYIIGRGSTWNNNELRYSLRSIEKNGINVGRVFMAGYIPDFVNKNVVTCLHVEDRTGTKHYNIMHAIEEAIDQLPISEHFLYSSDDHFYIKPTDFDNYPHYWRGRELPEAVVEGESHQAYHTTLLSTRKVLEVFDLPCMHFAWHGNTHFNTRLWNETDFKRMRKMSYIMPNGCEPTCLMNNYWIAREPFEPVQRRDIKSHPDEQKSAFLSRIEGREVCSSGNGVQGSYIAEYLRKQFPDKSIYEL